MNNFAWHSNYEPGVKTNIDFSSIPSLVTLLEDGFQKYAELPAYECMGTQLSYAEVDRYSKYFASFLTEQIGLERGDRIALQMPNVLQYPIALFGALRAGMVVVNTNPLYTAREMKHQFVDAEVKAVVVMEMFADKLEQILPETHIAHVIVARMGDMMPFPKRHLVNMAVKYIKKMVPQFNLPTAVNFRDALEKGSRCTFKPFYPNVEDIAFLQYTGGTTGVAKGAVLSHRNVAANVLQIVEWASALTLGKEIMITALPMYHAFSMTVNGFTIFRLGGLNMLIPNPRDINGLIRSMGKYKFSLFSGVNTLFNGLMNHPRFASLDFSNLKVVIGGGMSVQTAVAQRWEKITGRPLLEGYGLSETSPVLSAAPFFGKVKIGTIGLPFPSTELSLRDEDGNVVAPGNVGEICAKGPQVFRGYWNRPEESVAAFFPGEWFRTGDLGVMDEEGYFKIVDRKKDMILVSGFNVYPNEVEDVIAMHPKVLEVAVIGVPSDKSEEVVKAFIVKKDETLTVAEVREFCYKHLTAYKVPKVVEFRASLPKTIVGKILRKDLKEEELARYKKALNIHE